MTTWAPLKITRLHARHWHSSSANRVAQGEGSHACRSLKRVCAHFSPALLALLSLLPLTSPTLALPTDSEQDLFLESETLEYDENSGTITYSGSVLMKQGSMKIQADKVVIYGNIERATKVTANGKPATFQQTPEVGAVPVTAVANELEYTVSDKSLLLKGNAILEQEGSSLSSNRIEYDVTRAVVTAGTPKTIPDNEKRVRMVIPPKVLQADPK